MTGRAKAIISAITAALLLASCAYTTGVTGTEAGANPNQELPTFWRSIATLDDRSRHILESRWLTEDKLTLHELADEYGVSAERIRQVEANAIKKLRTAMAA